MKFYWSYFIPESPVDNNSAWGLGNGLARNVWQTISWTSNDQVHWHSFVPSNINVLSISYPLSIQPCSEKDIE